MEQKTASFAKALGKIVGSDPEEIREQLRWKCRKSLYFLSKAVLRNRDLTLGFHLRVCRFAQNPELKRRLGEEPRGHLKTTIYTRSKPIWRLIQEPDPPRFWGPNERILLTMSSDSVASIQIQAIEKEFEGNTLFKWLFPELIPQDFQKTIWNTSEMRIGGTSLSEPNISTIGVGTKVTGRHFTGIIEDDLVDETIADSELEIQRRVNWHQYAFPLLEEPSRDWMDTVGNRWGKRDINGWIKEHEPDCRVMTDAAITKDGVPLWPERFSLEALAKIRIKLGAYKFACQYMNDPKDAEGSAFHSGWLRYYEILPDGNFVLDSGELVKRETLWVYMTVDPAQTPGNRSDRTAIVTTGIDPKGRIFILDAVAVRKDPHEALTDVYDQYNKHKPSQLGVEAIAFQRLLVGALERMARARGQWLPVRPIKGSVASGAKEARINQVVGETFASGRAFLRREMIDFIDEYSWFPDPTTTRDLLDAYALSDLMWVFAGRSFKKDPDDANMWLRAARMAGMSSVTGY